MIRTVRSTSCVLLLLVATQVHAGEIVSHNGTNVVNATTGTGDVQVSLDNDFTYPFSFGNTDGAKLTKTFNEIAVHTMNIHAGTTFTLQPQLFVPPEILVDPGIDSTFEQVFNNTGYAWDSYHVSWSGPTTVSTGPSVGAFGPISLQEIDGNTFNIYFDSPLEIGGFFYLQMNFNIDPLFAGEIPDGEYGNDDGIHDGYIWDYSWTLNQYAVPHTPVEPPPEPIPEPGTFALLALGFIGLGCRSIKRRQTMAS